MPASGQHNEQAAATPDPSPELSERYGENPARFLQEDIHADSGAGTSGELIFARIRGIESISLARYWVAMERRLASINDREPRERVLHALAQRERYLEANGEGLPQTGMTATDRREAAAERDAESVATLLDKNDEAVSWSRQSGAVVGQNR
jgi:hypothetical protein